MLNLKLTTALILIIGSGCNNPRNPQLEFGSKSLKTIDTTKAISPTTYLKSEDFDILMKKYEDPGRGNWQNPNLVIQKLGKLQDKIVADIGAGSGYFTFRIAPNAQKTIAVDIDKNALEFIENRKLELSDSLYAKIEVRLSTKNDPLLSENEVDIILLVNTYHFIENREDYCKKLKMALKKDGKLVLVDFKQGIKPVGPPESLKIKPSKVVEELVSSGFKDIKVDSESLQYQYIIIAK